MIGRRPGDFVVVLLGGAVLAASFAVALAAAWNVDLLPDRELCWSRALLGRPCPGCGLTRSFVAAAGGDLQQAHAWNPTGPPLFALLAVVTLLHALRLAGTNLPWLFWADVAAAAAAGAILILRAATFWTIFPLFSIA